MGDPGPTGAVTTERETHGMVDRYLLLRVLYEEDPVTRKMRLRPRYGRLTRADVEILVAGEVLP